MTVLDAMVVLILLGRKFATKRISWAEGRWEIEPYARAEWFSIREVPVHEIGILGRVLSGLERDPSVNRTSLMADPPANGPARAQHAPLAALDPKLAVAHAYRGLRLGEHHHAACFAALEAMLPRKRGRQKDAEYSYAIYRSRALGLGPELSVSTPATTSTSIPYLDHRRGFGLAVHHLPR